MPPAKEGPDTALPPDGHCVGSRTDSSGGRVGWGSAGPGRQKGGARPGLRPDPPADRGGGSLGWAAGTQCEELPPVQ